MGLIIKQTDELYPKHLHTLGDLAPKALYCLGNVDLLSEATVSIITPWWNRTKSNSAKQKIDTILHSIKGKYHPVISIYNEMDKYLLDELTKDFVPHKTIAFITNPTIIYDILNCDDISFNLHLQYKEVGKLLWITEGDGLVICPVAPDSDLDSDYYRKLNTYNSLVQFLGALGDTIVIPDCNDAVSTTLEDKTHDANEYLIQALESARQRKQRVIINKEAYIKLYDSHIG